jgi:hypothetical protein
MRSRPLKKSNSQPKAYSGCKGNARRRYMQPSCAETTTEYCTPYIEAAGTTSPQECVNNQLLTTSPAPCAYHEPSTSANHTHCDTCICGAGVTPTTNTDASIQTDDAIIITVEEVPTVKEVCTSLQEVLQDVYARNSPHGDLPAINVGHSSPTGTATYSTGETRPSPGHSYTPLVSSGDITWDTAVVQPIAAIAPYRHDPDSQEHQRHLDYAADTTWETSDAHMSQVSLKKKNIYI